MTQLWRLVFLPGIILEEEEEPTAVCIEPQETGTCGEGLSRQKESKAVLQEPMWLKYLGRTQYFTKAAKALNIEENSQFTNGWIKVLLQHF